MFFIFAWLITGHTLASKASTLKVSSENVFERLPLTWFHLCCQFSSIYMTIAILGRGKGDSCALDIGHIIINILNICTASTEPKMCRRVKMCYCCRVATMVGFGMAPCLLGKHSEMKQAWGWDFQETVNVIFRTCRVVAMPIFDVKILCSFFKCDNFWTDRACRLQFIFDNQSCIGLIRTLVGNF